LFAVHTPLVQSRAVPQAWLVPHLLQLPPQSTSLSVPFFTVSPQVGTAHLFAVHTPLVQSAATRQALVSAHLLQLPPQSTSVSVPFFTLSVQPPGAHTKGLPVQTPLMQSAGAKHVFVLAHLGHVLPPQSASVSVPFFAPSRQVGVWHTLGVPVQTPLVQSPPTRQVLASAHLGQVPPPQSLSVSALFFTASMHVAATHLFAVQTLLAQSLASVQAPFVPQRLQLELPPQSVSLSPSFFTLSLHAGAMHMPPVHTPL
jgi:hypothetical protein